MIKYVRLLNWENTCLVLVFSDKHFGRNASSIVEGGIKFTLSSDNDFDIIVNYIKSLNCRYEIVDEPIHRINKQIIDDIKNGFI